MDEEQVPYEAVKAAEDYLIDAGVPIVNRVDVVGALREASAIIEADVRQRIAEDVQKLPKTRTASWLGTWTSVSVKDVLELLVGRNGK